MSPRPGRSALAAAALAALLAAAPARASLFDLYGFGARATAMGNAAVALGFNHDATWYNPANLLSRKQTHLALGFDAILPDLEVGRPSGEDEVEFLVPGSNVGFHLGLAVPVGGVFRDKLGLGVAFYHPLVKLTRIESLDPTRPHFYRYQNLPDKLIIAFGLAGEPLPWLRVGLGASVLADFGGDVTAAVSLKDGRFFREAIAIDLDFVVSPSAGLALGPWHGLRLGVAWRSPLELRYRLPIEVLIEEVGFLKVLIDGTSLYTPGQLSVGLGWESASPPGPGVSVEVGLTWERWSLAPPPDAVFALAIDDAALRGDERARDGRPTQDLIAVSADAIPLGARDTVTPRLGVEWRPTAAWAVRAGWSWRPTPLPEPIYQTNAMDATAHVASLGGGFAFRDPTRVSRTPLNIDLTAQATVLDRRVVEKAPDGTPDGVYWLDGVIWKLTLDLRHDF